MNRSIMNKIWVVARREFSAMVGTRAFSATLLFMPVLLFGGIFLIQTLNKISGGRERTIRVVDGTGRIAPTLVTMADQRNHMLSRQGNNKGYERKVLGSRYPDLYRVEMIDAKSLDDATRLDWSDAIRNGSLYAFVEIPESLLDVDSIDKASFVGQDSAFSEARQWMQGIIDAMVRAERFKVLGLDSDEVQLANLPVTLAPISPYVRVADGEGGERTVQAKVTEFGPYTLLAPLFLMTFMFMVIVLAAQPMLESAMEEKSQRISELLLGSVTPMQLLTGKLIGNVAASLLIFALYAAGGYAYLMQRNMHHLVPISLVPWFLVFQILGVLFFSSIFMMIGTSVRDLKEAQSLLLPVWLVMMLPILVVFDAARDPLGPVALTLGLFPPSAPMMNVLRLGTGVTIPVWQPILGAVALAAATAFVIWVAGRIYKTSMLRADSVKTLTQLIARIVTVSS